MPNFLNKKISTQAGILIVVLIALVVVGGITWRNQKFEKVEFTDLNLQKTKKESLPTFEDFPVSEIFEGTQAPINYSSHPSAMNFYTEITEGAKEKPNFAGHCTIIEWGCGTSCQTGVVFDAKTGNIYDIPVSELSKEYRVDSTLLIVNPNLEEVSKNYPGLIFEGISTRYYRWENNAFKPIKEVKLK